jgi:hypothetical protein
MLGDFLGDLLATLPIKVQAGCAVSLVLAVGVLLLWVYFG